MASPVEHGGCDFGEPKDVVPFGDSRHISGNTHAGRRLEGLGRECMHTLTVKDAIGRLFC